MKWYVEKKVQISPLVGLDCGNGFVAGFLRPVCIRYMTGTESGANFFVLCQTPNTSQFDAGIVLPSESNAPSRR